MAGDSDAFRTLFDRYAATLTRILGRRVGSSDEVADMVQQTFLQVHRARLDFRADGRFRPWIIAIALNVMRQRYRRKRVRKEVPLADEGAETPTAAPHDPVAADQRRRLHAALARLPESQREAIELHWLEGLPFPEVATAVGASVSAVKVRAHRGYARLRQELESQGVTAAGSRAP